VPIVTADDFKIARELYAGGAGFVYIPRLMGAGELAQVVITAMYGNLAEVRNAARAALEQREEVLE
jgi:hypothetical protein